MYLIHTKTNNQFINCTNVTSSIADSSYIGINTYASAVTGFGTEVSIRISSVINSLKLDPKSYFYTNGDGVDIDCLGKESNDIKFKNWILNIATSYDVESVSVVNSTNRIYELSLDKSHIFT